MNRGSSSPETLLEIVSRLDGLIDELKDGGQVFSAQLVAMARMELVMTVHQISEHEMDVQRSLIEDKDQRILS
jgi:cell division protein ZapA (FtsZ GTPase activity inhibitor)